MSRASASAFCPALFLPAKSCVAHAAQPAHAVAQWQGACHRRVAVQVLHRRVCAGCEHLHRHAGVRPAGGGTSCAREASCARRPGTYASGGTRLRNYDLHDGGGTHLLHFRAVALRGRQQQNDVHGVQARCAPEGPSRHGKERRRWVGRTAQHRVHAVVRSLGSQQARELEIMAHVVAAGKKARSAVSRKAQTLSRRPRPANEAQGCAGGCALATARATPAEFVAILAAEDAWVGIA